MAFREAWSYWKTILFEAAKGAISHARQKILLGFILSVIAFLIQYGLQLRNWTDTQKIAVSLLGAALIVMLVSFLRHLVLGPPKQQSELETTHSASMTELQSQAALQSEADKETIARLSAQIDEVDAIDRQIRRENFELNDRINELQTAATRQNCAATVEMERLGGLVGSLRAQLEAEKAKNAKPEIRGKVTNLHHTGVTSESRSFGGLSSGSGIEFKAYVCNHRQPTTTLKSVVVDGSELMPPAGILSDVQVLNLEGPGEPIILEYGMGRRFHVGTELRFAGQQAHHLSNVDLSKLRVYVVDGFGDRHLLSD